MWKRWIIRSVILSVLVLCVGGWAWSYAEQVPVFRYCIVHTDRMLEVWPRQGTLVARWGSVNIWTYMEGTSLHWERGDRFNNVHWYTLGFGFHSYREFELSGIPAPASSPHTFPPAAPLPPLSSPPPRVGDHASDVGIPFYFLTALLSLLTLLVWRKTRNPKIGGAFPVETAGTGEPA